MPYQESSYFKTPDKSDPLWRYMHIDFLAMLNGKSLYFPNIYSFNDKLREHYQKNPEMKFAKYPY